jgi:hypothetical protein
MSRRAWQRIVDGYEQYDPESMFDDNVCLYVVSKVMRGIAQTEKEEKQECPERKCSTLKRFGEYRMEIESGPCDSEMSASMLNGTAEGQLVAAYADADPAQRGGMSGKLKWAGSGATVVGRTLAMLNAGTHHDPLRDCEKCHTPGHAEGWLRGAIVEGDCTGGRVNGAISYNFEVGGEDNTKFAAVMEGLLIIQCHDD